MKARIEEKKYLSAKGLLNEVQQSFRQVKDPRDGRSNGSSRVPIVDCLMSGLAIFGLKFPSLLQFDEHRTEEIIRHNLKTLYQVKNAPCDTYLRERLDEVNPTEIRGAFTKVFAALQRGKALEKYELIDGYYLLTSDGSGFFLSDRIHCDNCCKKEHRDGSVSYYHMMLCAAIVHPDYKEVIPLCPEPIMNRDGSTKNDCERNASKRFLADFRREHPHLPVLLVEDALAANVPHLRLCKEHNIRFLTVVKPAGNKTVFEWLKGIDLEEHKVRDEKTKHLHVMRYYNGVPLNNSDPNFEVNFIEYFHYNEKGKQVYHNTWVTDLKVTQDNVFQLAKGGRARWRIENETFNTLKNQGYNFEHNYGHGNNNLSTIFGMLALLAFLIDQVQQMCCGLFQAALEKSKSRTSFWTRLKSAFIMFTISSWKDYYEGIIYGLVGNIWTPDTS